MAEKMFTSSDNPYMPKMKTDLSKLLSKKGLYKGQADAYWKAYGKMVGYGEKPTLPKPLTVNDVKPVSKKEVAGYKVGDIIKGNMSGNIYQIDNIDSDGWAHIIVKKTGPHGNQVPGDFNTASPEGLKASYTKVELDEKPKITGQSKISYGQLSNGDILYSSLNQGYKYKVTNVSEKGYDITPINKETGKESEYGTSNYTYDLDTDYMFSSEKDAKAAHDEWEKGNKH